MTRTVLDRQLQDLSEQLLQMWALSDQAFEKGLEALQRWDPIDQLLPLVAEEILLVVPPQHRLAERNHIHLREIAGEPLISLTSAYALQD